MATRKARSRDRARQLEYPRRTTQSYELPANAPEAAASTGACALDRCSTTIRSPPRVLANRVWQHHFGTGIVDTPNDFGYMGGRPTHPELLDWLAQRLNDNGWRLKPLHARSCCRRLIGKRARRGEELGSMRIAACLWRFPPRRLTAEEIRDTMLAVAGKLDLSEWAAPASGSTDIRTTMSRPTRPSITSARKRTAGRSTIRTPALRGSTCLSDFDCAGSARSRAAPCEHDDTRCSR